MEIKKSPNLMIEIINVREGELKSSDQCIAVMDALHVLEKNRRTVVVEGIGECVLSSKIQSRVQSMSLSEMYRAVDILERKGFIMQKIYHDLTRVVKSTSK